MKSLSRAGGFCALYLAVAYVVAMPFCLLVLNYPSLVDPLEKTATLVTHQKSLFAVETIVYVLFGLALVGLAVALYERWKSDAPALMKVATPMAFIWAGLLIASGMVFNAGIAPVASLYAESPAQAASLWSAIDAVSSGLSGNGEIVGGAWMLLVSLAALKARGLPKALSVLGLVVAVVGIVSAVPFLKDLAGVFGLGQIAWFVGLGVVMLGRKKPAEAAHSACTLAD